MVHHISWPVHKATVEKFGADWTKPGNMVSDGPYMLAEWVPQSKIVLKKNPYFHDAANVKIDTVIYYPTEDIGEEFKRFRAGELDMTYSVPTDQVKWAEKNMPNEYRNSPYFGTYYYVINLTREPLASNVNLRKALALAIDRDLLVNKITQGGEQPAYEWVPPGVPGYEQQPVDFASMTQKERNELAKKLYAEAGYSADNPLKVQVLHNTSERHRKIAIAIASMWKKTLGVDMTLTNQEWKVYLDSRDKKDFQIARAAWIGDYMDASNFLDLFVSTAGERNDAGYNNPKFDELLNAASLNPDPAARQKQLEEAERIFLTDLPIIPIYHYRNLNMISTKVKGWVPNVMGFNLTRYLSLE
jgi:oligopeptide transport system substrate-binding protein